MGAHGCLWLRVDISSSRAIQGRTNMYVIVIQVLLHGDRHIIHGATVIIRVISASTHGAMVISIGGWCCYPVAPLWLPMVNVARAVSAGSRCITMTPGLLCSLFTPLPDAVSLVVVRATWYGSECSWSVMLVVCNQHGWLLGVWDSDSVVNVGFVHGVNLI
jgi:hypothetical protein